MFDKNALFLKPVPTDDGNISALFRILDIDFPIKARIPLILLRASLRKRRIKAVYLTDQKQTVYGYVIYQHAPGYGLLHILYLAILPRYRSAGLGSVLLERIREWEGGKGIILDAEDPKRAGDEEERAVCTKRISFYRRNGYRVYPGFQFVNFGYYLRVLSDCPLPKLSPEKWLRFYRSLYDNAYGIPVSWFMIKAYKRKDQNHGR